MIVERASNAARARYVLRTSPSAHGVKRPDDYNLSGKKKDQTREGGPNVSIEVGQTGLSKALASPPVPNAARTAGPTRLEVQRNFRASLTAFLLEGPTRGSHMTYGLTSQANTTKWRIPA
jgi:hypothetical protein